MTIPFRCTPNHQREQNVVPLTQQVKIYQSVLEETGILQSTWRRVDSVVTGLTMYVCRTLFQLPMSRARWPSSASCSPHSPEICGGAQPG